MKKTLLKLMLILTLFTTTIVAEEKLQAVIIFDASASMWEQIDGVNKITIAKEALNKVVNEWNPNVELGLTVYGHRKKGDCSDIETAVPVSIVDKDKIISIIKKIQPKGKTPIARTLQKVAEELKFTEEKATIILISDGKDSCDADPCAVAKNLEKRGIDFVTHVIGFNVDKKTDKQLECIADETGGEYFSANNATALNEAMKTIVKKVEKVEPTPTPTPKATPTPKKLKNNLEITASEKEGSKWVDATCYIRKFIDGEVDTSDYWGIHPKKKNIHPKKKNADSKQLPVGKYQLECKYNDLKKVSTFELKDGEVTKLHIVFEQFRIETKCTDMNANVNYEVYANSGRMVHDAKMICSKALQLSLDAGDYRVEATVGSDKKEKKFTIGKDSKKLIINMSGSKK